MRWQAAVVAALAAWCAVSPRRGLARLVPRPSATARAAGPALPRLVESPVQRTALCLAGGTVIGWAFAGPIGIGVGAVAGLLVSRWLGRLETPSQVRARERVARDLPIAIDLLAACSTAGRTPAQSLAAVADAIGGPLADRLNTVAARVSLGGDPAGEWARLAHDPQLGGLGRALERTTETGAPLADGLARLSADHRRLQRAQSQTRARSVGVKAAGPLALCFLPSFMVLGVVPTVASGFIHLLG